MDKCVNDGVIGTGIGKCVLLGLASWMLSL